MDVADTVQQLPDEMFNIIQSARTSLGPRLGRLSLPGRQSVETPTFFAITSRGVVPHLTPDNFKPTQIGGVYVALEDFIEHAPQRVPPLYKYASFVNGDGSNGVAEQASPTTQPLSALRKYIALSDRTPLVLGARRSPPVVPPAASSNTNTSVSVCTSVGFKTLKAAEYAEVVETLGADVIIGLGDVPFGRALGSKRAEKATDRSMQWIQVHVDVQKRQREEKPATRRAKLFAPLLPMSCANQRFYFEFLEQDIRGQISGLAIYDSEALHDFPLESSLNALPRLGFMEPGTPQDALRQISDGLDIVTLPLINSATDAGIALDFSFPVSNKVSLKPASSEGPTSSLRPLGIDMWSPTHATDLSPLIAGCPCSACTTHHRAYIQHLLAAKEMLGWVLLQLHNHEVVERFFNGIRQSLRDGSFDHETQRFEVTYESHMPEKTGQGPRVRGYQFKAEGPSESKKNVAPFTMLNDGKEKVAEAAALPDNHVAAGELAENGFADRER